MCRRISTSSLRFSKCLQGSGCPAVFDRSGWTGGSDPTYKNVDQSGSGGDHLLCGFCSGCPVHSSTTRSFAPFTTHEHGLRQLHNIELMKLFFFLTVTTRSHAHLRTFSHAQPHTHTAYALNQTSHDINARACRSLSVY